MSGTVTLFTDRNGFEPVWRAAFESLGLEVRTSTPDELPGAIKRNSPIVVDASSNIYDEDELLSAVGFARALGAIPVVHLPDTSVLASVEDVVEEMCSGLVARSEADIERVATSVARRLDRERTNRFEFVTVSPRDKELLAILGDGRAVLLPRPANEEDDSSEVLSITLSEDATSAMLQLASGHTLHLSAEKVAPKAHENGSGANGHGIPIDGARLGARLRELRLEAGLTQAELARRTGIHRPNIARVEAGRHTPSLETLSRLASAIGVATTRVLSED